MVPISPPSPLPPFLFQPDFDGSFRKGAPSPSLFQFGPPSPPFVVVVGSNHFQEPFRPDLIFASHSPFAFGAWKKVRVVEEGGRRRGCKIERRHQEAISLSSLPFLLRNPPLGKQAKEAFGEKREGGDQSPHSFFFPSSIQQTKQPQKKSAKEIESHTHARTQARRAKGRGRRRAPNAISSSDVGREGERGMAASHLQGRCRERVGGSREEGGDILAEGHKFRN